MANDGNAAWFVGRLRAHPVLFDVVAAAAVLAAFEMPAFDPYRHDGGNWWAFWGFAVAAPFLWRRRAPALAAAVSLIAAAGALVTRSGPNWGVLSEVTILLGPALALAFAAATTSARVSKRLALATGAVIVVAAGLASSSPDAVIAQLVLLGGAWLTGEAVRARRHEMALLRELVTSRAEQAADGERARIARELHDVVAHHLSVIAIQAGAARLLADDRSLTTQSLATIEHETRLALAEVRRAVGVLRNGDGDGVSPQPRLDQLPRLAERLRDAGLPVTLNVTGDLTEIPDGIATSAYRVVQEALTNVVNHAGPVRTTVSVASSSAELCLEVCNERPANGPVSRPDVAVGGGHGIIGMRERVGAYGGTIDAGVARSGGFQVTARIPLP